MQSESLQLLGAKYDDKVKGNMLSHMHAVQSPGLPQVDHEEMVGRELRVKVLEAIEENDRLVLSNRKNAFGQKKLTYSVSLLNAFRRAAMLAANARTSQKEDTSAVASLPRWFGTLRTCMVWYINAMLTSCAAELEAVLGVNVCPVVVRVFCDMLSKCRAPRSLLGDAICHKTAGSCQHQYQILPRDGSAT